MSQQTATFRVLRYNPEANGVPQYMKFTIPVKKGVTVLDGLRYIRDQMDGTLGLRFSCRSAICGSCSMKINGFTKLACKTQALDEMEEFGEIRVDPMHNMRVVKDLIVDMTPFWNHMKHIRPWLIKDPSKPIPTKEHLMTPDQVKAFEGTPNCIVCGACFSECPAAQVDPAFPGPAALAKAYRFAIDPRDDSHKERMKEYGSADTWLCVRCSLCVEACPKDVRPGEMITKLKEIAVQEGVTNNLGAHHAQAFRRNIEVYGNLNELKLVKDTVGMLGALKKLPKMINVVGMNKRPPDKLTGPLRMKPIPDIEQIRRIYEEAEKED